MTGPWTTVRGTLGWTTLPSGIAHKADAAKIPILAQPGEEILCKKWFPDVCFLIAQVVDICGCKMGIFHPVQQPLEASVDAVTGLM